MTAAAIEVLRGNDLGGWTRAAPRLYPHQWSWDSAFIAIGLAQVDPGPGRAGAAELFAAQWATGQCRTSSSIPDVPPESYYPGAECWTWPAVSRCPGRPPAG